jgi:hypothetical protein
MALPLTCGHSASSLTYYFVVMHLFQPRLAVKLSFLEELWLESEFVVKQKKMPWPDVIEFACCLLYCGVAYRFTFDPPYWTGISSSAKDLITQLLRTNPEKRATAAQVLTHPWIRGAVSSIELSSALSQMKVFQHRKRTVLRCGLLVKQGFYIRNWKLRFFVLTAEELQYYDPEDIPLQQQLQPVDSVADLGKGTARPKGVIRLKDINSVTSMDVLLPGTGPKFPRPTVSAATSTNATSSRSISTSSEGVDSSVLLHAPDVVGRGSSLSAGNCDSAVAPSCATSSEILAGSSSDQSVSWSRVVPATASGDFRWGLRLSSSAAAGSREYIVLADSEASREKWSSAISTVNHHGDLVRRAGLAMAMGDAHLKDAVGLMRMAQQWHDTVMSPVVASRSVISSNSVRRRMRKSRHPLTRTAQTKSDDSSVFHVKVCMHTSSASLQVPGIAGAIE